MNGHIKIVLNLYDFVSTQMSKDQAFDRGVELKPLAQGFETSSIEDNFDPKPLHSLA